MFGETKTPKSVKSLNALEEPDIMLTTFIVKDQMPMASKHRITHIFFCLLSPFISNLYI